MVETSSKDLMEPEQTGFRREMGLFDGINLVVGIMVGSGVFYIGAYVLQRTGMSPGLSLLCWIIGGLCSLLGSICFAELGAERPLARGSVAWLSEAYHPIVGFSANFTSLFLSGSGSIAALAIAIPSAFMSYFGLNTVEVKLIAISLIIALAIYNCLGVKMSAILEDISTVAKLIPVAIVLFAGLIFGKQTPNLSLIPAQASVSFGGIMSMIAFATVSALWAYEGWANLGSMGEEMKNPDKNIPRALIFGVLSVTVLYVLFNFAILKIVPFSKIASMVSSGNFYLGTEAARMAMGGIGEFVVVAGMAIAMFGCLQGMIVAFPRGYYVIGKQSYSFRNFAQINPKNGIPTTAIIATAIISCVLVLLRNLGQLTALVIFCGMIYNFLTVIAVIIYRKKFPDLERPYKVWGYPFTVILAAAVYAFLAVETFMNDPVTATIGCIVPAISILVYYIGTIREKRINQLLEQEPLEE